MEIVLYSDQLKDSLFEFTDRCFRDLGKLFEPEGRHSFYNDIGKEFDRFWCLLEDGEVVGTVGIKPFDEETSELKAMYLSSELRGQGLGYKLLDTAVDFARDKGCSRVVLDSMLSYDAALRLYSGYGFKEIERYNDNRYAQVFMELIL
ncbi:MAG: GNAT family N-acetyltransferase [Clostridiales bacterium]|nr:GNAT family N-acetyltransferase [Clostridiales bacterium]